MDGLPPPTPVLQAPRCAATANQVEADKALVRLSGELRGTEFTAAWPACIPGLIAVQMNDGSVAYTDKNARYLVLGLVFDISTGKALDRQMDGSKE